MVKCPACHASYPDGVFDCPRDGHALLPDEAFAAADAPLAPGTMAGEYRVDTKLGSGTFGAVYAGEQPVIGKKVAIKVLHRKFSSDPEVVSRFIAEARAVNRIRHRHIIDIFSFGLLDNRQHYFVMELVEGLTLGELLKQKQRLSVAQALPILRGIAAGLDAAHKAGVTHRDLKPDNIFLATEGEERYFPKLLDFGVAKLVTDEMAHRTATGLAVGTPRYMSPEQARGKKVDHRADIYALGVVIHQMLTGQCPFDGDSVMDVLLKHTLEPAPRMSSIFTGLPRALDEPVLAMLAKRPDARPDSAGEAVAALIDCARSLGLDQEPSSGPRLDGVKAKGGVAGGTERLSPAAATVELGKADRSAGGGTTDVALSETVQSDERQVPVSLDDPGLSEMLRSDERQAVSSPVDSSVPVMVQSPASSTPAAAMARSPVTGTLVSGGAGAAAAGAEDPAAARTGQDTRSAPAGRRWAWVAVAAGGVVLASLAVMRGRPEQGSGASTVQAPASGGASTEAPASASTPSVATIRFAVTPVDADILVDGRHAGPASKPLVLPHSGERHAIRIERQGYEAQTLWVVADRDQELSPVVLEAIVTASSAAPPKPLPQPVRPPENTKKPSLHKDLQKPPELGGPKQR